MCDANSDRGQASPGLLPSATSSLDSLSPAHRCFKHGSQFVDTLPLNLGRVVLLPPTGSG